MTEQALVTVDEMLISVAPGETRGALLERGRLQRLVVDRPGCPPRIGDLFVGRVIRTVVALEAAFVDIGLAEAGFLALAEARPASREGGTIRQFVNEGERVVVQVIRKPEGGKGSKLTMRPAIAGPHLVFHPGATGVVLAGDPPVAAERDNLDWYERGLPCEAGGWTVLPAAAGVSQDIIANEALRLCARWQDALARSRPMKPPALLADGPDPVVVALSQALSPARVRPALVRVVVDDARMAATLRSAFPEAAAKIETDLLCRSLFSEHALEEQIEALLSPVVDLQCGGTVLIEQTAAVVCIDVDAGAADEGSREATALAVNQEAADVIVRQINLRDLAGHVVIDFVPMRRRDNERKLLRRLTRAFARHGLAVDLAGFTRLGLVEFTRRRERPSLPDTMLAPCPACAGHGRVLSPLTVALKSLRDVVAEDRAAPGRAWGIEAAPQVITAFGKDAMDALRETEARLGRPLRLYTSALCAPDMYKLVAVRDRERE